MPIQLTTPYNAGDDGGGATYTQAKIVEFRLGTEHDKRLEMFVEWGDTVDGNWVPGISRTVMVEIRDGKGPNIPYSTFLGANAQLVTDVSVVLYNWLITNYPRMAGTIV